MSLTDLDFEGIRALFGRFSHTLDFGDADGFVACFTSDGVLDSTAPEQGMQGEHRGPDALRRFVAASIEHNAGRVRHTMTCSRIEGDGDVARASSYVFVTRDYGPPEIPGDLTHAELVTTGIVDDEVAKVDGRWLLKRRNFQHDGLPHVISRFGRPLSVGPVSG